MYIFCPKCNTAFVIKNEEHELINKKLKCSKCGNIWHAFKKEYTTDNSSKTNLPVIIPKVYFKSLYYITIGVLISIIYLGMLYGLKSIADGPTKGLVLEVAQIMKEEGKLKICYRVMNNSDTAKHLPFTKIKLLNNNNNIIESRIFSNTIVIEPGKYALIAYEFIPSPEDVSNVEVIAGTKLGLILRELLQ